MNKNVRTFFIKNTIILGVVYSVFFIVFNSFVLFDLNVVKTIFVAFFFAFLMSSYTCSSELRNYKRLLKGEIALHDIIPSAEGTMKTRPSFSLDKARQLMNDAGFIISECYDNHMTFTTVHSWCNAIPITVFVHFKEGMLNIKLYKFTRTSFMESKNPKDVLDDVKAIISSCS
ncbi:MAG: hypothetical protein WBG43_03790 [Marinifilaceae bacterium]